MNLNMFKKSRVIIDTLVQDTVDFMVDKFKQSRQMFTVASAYGQIVFVLENLAQMILYYIEDSITELNIYTATRPTSVYGLASLAGHNPTRAQAATGEVAVSPRGNPSEVNGGVIVIPNHTRIKSLDNGLTYMLDLPGDEVRVPAGRSTTGLRVLQGTLETQSFTGTGRPLQVYTANFQQSVLIDHHNVNVYVNGTRWKPYDALYDMPRGAQCYMVRTAVYGGIDVIFGNENFGAMPDLGQEVLVEYVVTAGFAGNVILSDGQVAQFRWDDPGLTVYGEDVDLNEHLSIRCVVPPDFGADPESLKLTRLVAPKTSRAMVLANPDNYVILMEKLNQFSIIDAYATYDDMNLNDDKVIYLFLVPDVARRLQTNETYYTVGEDRFKLTAAQKGKVLEMVERSGSRVVSTELQIVDPVISRFVVNVAVIMFENGPAEEVVRYNIEQRIADYFLSNRRRDRIPKSDIISILESIDGVDSVSVSFVSQKDELGALTGVPPKKAGLDEFGDIIIAAHELPIVRGGWSDRSGIAYDTGINRERAGCVNVVVKGKRYKNYNAAKHIQVKQRIRNQTTGASSMDRA